MQLQEDLLTVFSGRLEDVDGSPVIRIPERELELGDLEAGETYRIAVLNQSETQSTSEETTSEQASERTPRGDQAGPPIEVGDQIEVEIEDIGEQGDGVARVGPGYIVFIPDANIGDRVTAEVTKTLENFAFAEVTTPEPISE